MTIPQEDIRIILEAGVQAPSGENAQPWRFIVHRNEISVLNIPERDQSLYSWGQRASYFAHGTLLENMAVAGRALGYKADIKLFPDHQNMNLTALVTLTATLSIEEDRLHRAIPERTTNRKPYKNTSLTPEQRSTILNIGSPFPDAQLFLIEDIEKRRAVAYAASVNEEILFGNELMHRFFFDHITWTKKEDEKKSMGFYIKTLELPILAKLFFRVLKYWRVAKILGRLGFPKRIAHENAKNVYITGAAHGAIVIHDNQPEAFIQAGRLMERVWLTVTDLGLSLQPLAGVAFLMQGILAGETQPFTLTQLARMTSAYETMNKAYGITNELLVMAFRIGEGGAPTARASRLPPIIRFE